MSDRCPHWFSHGCAIAGKLADTDYLPVGDDACRYCTGAARPGPRQLNSVTAGIAMRYLRAHDPGKLKRKRHILSPYIGCCPPETPGTAAAAATSSALRLLCDVSPGDVMTMTAAVRSLAAAHPGRWKVAVHTTAPEIWDHNPDLSALTPDEAARATTIQMHYPAIDRSNQSHVPFLAGYTEFLAAQLGVDIPLATNRPHLYLSDEERGWIPQVRERVGGRQIRYWVIDAGVKADYTAKQWPVESYQEVVDRTRRLGIEWVQIGAAEHDHPALERVIDLRGQTDTRQLIRLVYHASGGVGPVTFLQHLCAAWEKPYVCLLGGREPVTWVTYPHQHTLHTIGMLPCCQDGACWRSRVVPRGDGAKQDTSLCERPITSGVRPVGACMQHITPDEVVAIVGRYR